MFVILLLGAANVLVSEMKIQRTATLTEVTRSYKVCDFGLSRVLGDDDGAEPFGASAASAASADAVGGRGRNRNRDITGGIGTSLYMAPEVIVSDKAVMGAHPFASDVYSYAILAWQVLDGERPFVHEPVCAGLTMAQIKERVVGC